jgi:hypothetical protein
VVYSSFPFLTPNWPPLSALSIFSGSWSTTPSVCYYSKSSYRSSYGDGRPSSSTYLPRLTHLYNLAQPILFLYSTPSLASFCCYFIYQHLHPALDNRTTYRVPLNGSLLLLDFSSTNVTALAAGFCCFTIESSFFSSFTLMFFFSTNLGVVPRILQTELSFLILLFFYSCLCSFCHLSPSTPRSAWSDLVHAPYHVRRKVSKPF